MYFIFVPIKTTMKLIVSFVAVFYTILLLTGNIPSFSKQIDSYHTPSSSLVSESSGWKIVLDSPEIVYDGSEPFYPTVGVTVVDNENTPIETEIFSTIRPIRGRNQKEISYTVTAPTGESISNSRTLILKNYKGPSIQLSESLPSISEDNLNSLSAYLSGKHVLQALDGYDNDISNSVTYEWTHDAQNPLTLHITFQIENQFLDTYVAKADFHLQLRKPYIALSNTTIKLDRNAVFDPYSYIQVAMDQNGNLLSDAVMITGNVNTSTPGVYMLSYTLSDSSGNLSAEKFLNVVVE